jgi:Ca-activated chloride channel family protein
MKRAIVLAVVACGGPSDAPPVVAAPPVDEVVHAKPGVDLEGPIQMPDRSGPVHVTSAAPVDLASDRAIVHVSVPEVPRGGATGFSFADDRSGWVARIPDTVQLPAVAYGAGQVFVSGGFESKAFYALDASSGRVTWATANLNDPGPTAAVYDNGRVIFNTESCSLFALDARSGRVLWSRVIGSVTLAQTAVADELVFAAHPEDHSGGYELTAYRITDGEPVWSHAITNELLAAPVISGDSVYASTADGSTYRLRRATGSLVWSEALEATTAPWIAGDELYVSRMTHGKEQQLVVSATTGKVIRTLETSEGRYVWDVPDNKGDLKALWAFEGSRPVIDRGVRYVAMGGEVFATVASTGEPLWRRRYAGKTDQRSVGSVALAGSEVVVSTRDGKLFGLDVDTGYTLWSYDIGHHVVAEPIIAKGWIYAATKDGYVIALHVADPTLDGWHMFGGNAQHDGIVPG